MTMATRARGTAHVVAPGTTGTNDHYLLDMRPAFARRYDTFTARMEEAWLDAAREDLLSGVSGTVVEIGAGTGRNLRHYPATVDRLVLTEPTAAMRDQLRERVASADLDFGVEIVDATADRIPVPDGSADHVVSTLVLCSVPDLRRAATEIRRVLRPEGSLHLVEHVAADSRRERAWQHRLDRAWTWLEGSCHLDHDTPRALEAAGFDVAGVDRTRPKGQPPLFRDVVVGTATAG